MRIILFFLFASAALFAQPENLSNGTVFEGEPFVAINPVNHQNIVVAWMGFVLNNSSGLTIKVKSSFDGGASWSAAAQMPHVNKNYKSADVSMVFDDAGNLFICYIDWRESPDSGGVYVRKSTDGGLTWNTPVKALDVLEDGNKRPLDRPFLAMSPDGKNLFITTKPAPWIAAPNRNYLTVSTNGGQTWKPWRYIDDTGYLVGNVIAAPMAFPAHAGKNKFVCAYPSYLLSQSVYPRYILASSTNAGTTLNYNVILSGLGGSSNDSTKVSYQLLVNPADTNHYAFLYCYGTGGDFDVMFTESTNAGVNWSTPARINDDPVGVPRMQDMIWGSFDNDGDLLITWRDRRGGTNVSYNNPSEFYYAFRQHGSNTFNANKSLSKQLVSFNSVLEKSGNDFMSAVLLNDTISAAWGETRDGSLDIWFVRVVASSGTITDISAINHESNFKVLPNISSGLYTAYCDALDGTKTMVVVNALGEQVKNYTFSSSSLAMDLSSLPAGNYFCIVIYNNEKSLCKIVKQ